MLQPLALLAACSLPGLVAASGALKSLSRLACALSVSACLQFAAPAPARASAAAPARQEEPRAPNALVTGFVIAGGSLAAGGYVLASDRSLDAKRHGLYLMHGGLTLAPLAAHLVAGEWRRGAIFSLAPALAGMGMVALLALTPEAPIRGKNKSQRIYPVLITVGVLGSAVGIFDAAFVDERRAERQRAFAVSVGAAASSEFTGALAYGSF